MWLSSQVLKHGIFWYHFPPQAPSVMRSWLMNWRHSSQPGLPTLSLLFLNWLCKSLATPYGWHTRFLSSRVTATEFSPELPLHPRHTHLLPPFSRFGMSNPSILFPRSQSSKALCTPTNGGYPSDIYLAICSVSGEGNYFRVKLWGLIGLSSSPVLQLVGSVILDELDYIFLCSKLFFWAWRV